MKCSVLVAAPATLLGVWVAIKTGQLHPSLDAWAYATAALMWAPLPISVPAQLEHDHSHKTAHRVAFLVCATVWALSIG